MTFWDRLYCLLVHRPHIRWTHDGYAYRRCTVLGCGILVRRELALARLRRRARKAAMRGWGA